MSLIALLKLDGNVIMLTNTHTYLEEDDVIKDEKVRMESWCHRYVGLVSRGFSEDFLGKRRASWHCK